MPLTQPSSDPVLLVSSLQMVRWSTPTNPRAEAQLGLITGIPVHFSLQRTPTLMLQSDSKRMQLFTRLDKSVGVTLRTSGFGGRTRGGHPLGTLETRADTGCTLRLETPRVSPQFVVRLGLVAILPIRGRGAKLFFKGWPGLEIAAIVVPCGRASLRCLVNPAACEDDGNPAVEVGWADGRPTSVWLTRAVWNHLRAGGGVSGVDRGGRCARPPAHFWPPDRGGSCPGALGRRAKRRGCGTWPWRRTSRFVGPVDGTSWSLSRCRLAG
jgi:hypothetical protein